MAEREAILFGAAAFALVLVALGVMAALHEKHYRSRRERISEARASEGGMLESLSRRLTEIEEILCEDRAT